MTNQQDKFGDYIEPLTRGGKFLILGAIIYCIAAWVVLYGIIKLGLWALNYLKEVVEMNFVIIILSALFLSGCGAYFGKQSQYDKGDWYLFASSSEVARMERNKQTLGQKKVLDQLAVDKLKAQPAYVQLAQDGTPLGYKGIVANASRNRAINTIINGGPEGKGYFLQPKEEKEDFLLPGNYTACSYERNKDKVCWNFSVGPQVQYYNGKGVHWYTVYNPN